MTGPTARGLAHEGIAAGRERGRSDPARTRLAQALVERGLITPSELDWALSTQVRTGSRIGTILVSAGLVRRIDVYRTLADVWQHPFVDVTASSLDGVDYSGLDPHRLAEEGWLPIGPPDGDGTSLVATAEEPTAARRRAIEIALGSPVRLAVTTDWDILHGLRRAFRVQVAEEAANGLWQRDPDHSAKVVLVRSQVVFAVSTLALMATLTVAWPRAVGVVVSAAVGIGYLISVGFKFAVCMRGAARTSDVPITAADLAVGDEAHLPYYSVLVPVYREAGVVADLIANLGALDYPADKLEILLLLEESDDETRRAAMAADCPQTITFVTVPPGGPQTKPKACNVGLFFARGEFLVIYDAEDRPDPDQLKKAVIAFRRAEQAGDRSLVCVQAALNYWNAGENALTRLFTLEYSFWFDYMLPGLEALRLPIPLGGTSNHFRTAQLRQLGGWDPYNVTEDADLGIRAAALGMTVGVIDSTTYEEANRAYGNWIRQRSRWIKGYLQTTLVHLRHPRKLVAEVGWRQGAAFGLLVGGTPLSFLFAPPLYALFVASLVIPTQQIEHLFPSWVLYVGTINLVLGNSMMVYVAMLGAFKRERYRLVMVALANPLYWMLHSIAAYKALWQLVFRPHYWEKTTHGLSTSSAAHHGSGSTP